MRTTDTRMRRDFVDRYLEQVRRCLDSVSVPEVLRFVQCLEDAYRDDRQVFIAGNGGSAATASHMTCDLAKNVYPQDPSAAVRRFRVTSLTDNVPLMTALANDSGYASVFSEQLRNLLLPDDLLVVISASGNSTNIIEAIHYARERGARTAALLGFDGGEVRNLVDVALVVDFGDYGHVEDVHLIVNHLVVAWLRQVIGGR